jgi:hypothetical protein
MPCNTTPNHTSWSLDRREDDVERHADDGHVDAEHQQHVHPPRTARPFGSNRAPHFSRASAAKRHRSAVGTAARELDEVLRFAFDSAERLIIWRMI